MMTKFELNKAIAEALGWPICGEVFGSETAIGAIRDGDSSPSYFDFNNWNDLMPLVEKYNICYYIQSSKWRTSCELQEVFVDGADLQRALAECLLKVLESKKCSD